MPFGVIYAALVFVVVALWSASRLLASTGGTTFLSGASVGLLALSVAIALVLRQRWARWFGMVLGALLAALGAIKVVSQGAVLDFVLFAVFLLMLALLALPATGDARRGLPAGEVPFRRTGRVLLVLALVAFVSIVGLTLLERRASAGRTGRPAPGGGLSGTAAPAPLEAPGADGLSWIGYGEGLEKARAAGKPVLVEFYATWCGVCRTMERRTFRDPSVVRALERWVTVRVNAEETRTRGGHRGVELAERFGVEVYPTLVLLSSSGKEIERRTGFLSPRDLVTWVEPHAGRGGAGLVAETR